MKDNYSAVSESIATLSDRLAIMTQADTLLTGNGAYCAIIHLQKERAHLYLAERVAEDAATPKGDVVSAECNCALGEWQIGL